MKTKLLCALNVIIIGLQASIFCGCSSKTTVEKINNKDNDVDVVAVGLTKSQSKTFGDYYAHAVKSSDAWQRGSELNKEGRYEEAIEEFSQSLKLADSRVTKAMAYSGLATSYAGLKQRDKQIEYMEKEANATLNKDHQAQLLQQIADIKASSSDTIPDAVREGRVGGEE